MAIKATLTNNNGDKVYPQTLTEQVFNSDGTSLADSLEGINSSPSTKSYNGLFTITCSNTYELNFKINGKKSISIRWDELEEPITYELTEETTISYIYKGIVRPHVIQIIDAQNIIDFTADSQCLTSIVCNGCDSLKNLYLKGNTIEDCSILDCKYIQRLHILGNPIASNKEKMTTLINQLPDRNNQAYGSIVLYDFVNPIVALTTEQTAMRELRRELEIVSIPKDWYFGAAIRYNESEWAKTLDTFRYSHVEDIWESAEFGEGITAGYQDSWIDTNAEEFNANNFVTPFGTVNRTTLAIENETKTYTQAGLTTASLEHGTATSSLLIGNGKKKYGIAPKAKIYNINNYVTSSDQGMANIINGLKAKNVDYIVLTIEEYYARLFNDWPDPDDERLYYKDFSLQDSLYHQAVKNCCDSGIPVFQSSSNRGDRTLITIDDYGDPLGKNVPEVFTVGGFKSFKEIVDSNGTHKSYVTISDEYSVIIYSNVWVDWVTWAETSFSCPAVGAKCALYMNLFKKKYNRKPTVEELHTFVKERTIGLSHLPRTGVGAGYIDFMTYNYNEVHRQEPTSITPNVDAIEIEFNEKIDLSAIIAPKNVTNENYRIEAETDRVAAKIGNDFYSRMGNGNLNIYALDNPNIMKSVPIVVSAPTTKTTDIEKTPLYSGIPTIGQLSTVNLGKTFTVQLHFTDYKVLPKATDGTYPGAENVLFSLYESTASGSKPRETCFYNAQNYNRFGYYCETASNSYYTYNYADVGKSNLGNIVFTFAINFEEGSMCIYVQDTLIIKFYCFVNDSYAPNQIRWLKQNRWGTVYSPSNSIWKTCRVYDGILTQEEVTESVLYLLTSE